MKKISKYFKNTLYFFIFLSAFIIAAQIAQNMEKPNLVISKQQSSLNINQFVWNYFHLGQKRFFSSLFWIATILESDHEHYQKKDLNSWMFLRFNTIHTLEPKFYENYLFGGQYLSIIKDDIEGASDLYLKGLNQYPSDFKLLRDSAFHFYFEALDYENARKIYKRLETHPQVNPRMLLNLARIESESGNLEAAYDILLNNYETLQFKNEFLAKKIWSNLYAIKAEIDLKCLNRNVDDKAKLACGRNDIEGVPYIFDFITQKFIAQKKWYPFKNKSLKK